MKFTFLTEGYTTLPYLRVLKSNRMDYFDNSSNYDLLTTDDIYEEFDHTEQYIGISIIFIVRFIIF